MKKLILFAAILFAGVSVVHAQTSDNGNVDLTVNLSAVQSIIVDGSIVIDYLTADDYDKGKGSEDKTTLSVTSSGCYAIRVTATDLQGPAGSTPIAASTIKVAAKGVSDNAKGSNSEDIETTDFAINNTDALISSDTGGSKIEYEISYKGTGADAYYDNYNSATDSESGIQKYTTKVTYTITAS